MGSPGFILYVLNSSDLMSGFSGTNMQIKKRRSDSGFAVSQSLGGARAQGRSALSHGLRELS